MAKPARRVAIARRLDVADRRLAIADRLEAIDAAKEPLREVLGVIR